VREAKSREPGAPKKSDEKIQIAKSRGEKRHQVCVGGLGGAKKNLC